MIFHIDTLLPALEVNGMALLQGKPMVEVAFVAVYTFPAMFSTVFVHCKASSHYNPWTRPLHPFHTLLHSISTVYCIIDASTGLPPRPLNDVT